MGWMAEAEIGYFQPVERDAVEVSKLIDELEALRRENKQLKLLLKKKKNRNKKKTS